MLSTYDGYRHYARDLAASAARVAAQGSVKRDTDRYRAAIGKVTTVDGFLNDDRLYRYAMTSFGLEDAIPNRGFMRRVLTSDLSDPKSFANTLSDRRYRAMAAAYAFGKGGAVASTAAAQDAAQEDETLGLYSRQSFVGTAKADDVTYYKSHIGRVTSVAGLEGDPRLLRIALQAYGLDPATTAMASVTSLLESDPADPNSVANRSGAPGDAAQSLNGTRAMVALHAAQAGSDAASLADAAVETAYAERAIPDVSSVDAFLSDGRLVDYALKAFGLDPDKDGAARAYAVARGMPVGGTFTAAQRSDLLRAVLTSDLSAPGSAAATLGGDWRRLAASFDFGATALQSPADTDATVSRYAARPGADPAETAYYAAALPGLKSPADLVADPRLLAIVVKAYGLAFPPGTSPAGQAADVQAALAGDPTDPAGAAAKLGAAFVAMASDFASARVTGAQTAAAAESTVDLYGQASGATAEAAVETRYFLDTMPSVKSADALLADPRLLAYVVMAYGIAAPAGATAADTRVRLRAALVSDPSDPDGAAASGGEATRRLASAFRFDATGAVSRQPRASAAAGAAQTPAAADATADLYAERLGPDPLARAKGAIETAFYRAAMGQVRSVDDLLADDRLVAYVAGAYGVTIPKTMSAADGTALLRGILTSDLDDPKSVASQTGDGARAMAAAFTFGARYVGDAAVTDDARPDRAAFAAAFNFDAEGKVADPHLAQSARDAATTLVAFRAAAADAGIGSGEAADDASYYAASIGKVRTLGGFLSDPRLVAVATVAAGVTRPAGLTDAAWTARLRSALTSDLADPKNAASALGAPWRRLAAAFRFARDGSIARTPAQRAQSAGAADLLADAHAEAVMEDQAGAADPGVKLALYFQRQAPKLTSLYGILADKDLLKVVETALGLPANFSKVDIDAQARMLGRKLKLADFADPRKLDGFVRRFAVLYDAAKAKATPPATPLDATAGGTQAGGNTMLAALHPTPTATGTASLLQLFTRG